MSVVPSWCANYSGNISLYLVHFHCSKVEVNMTSCQPVQTDSQMESIRFLCETSEVVLYAAFWFTIAVGIVGNTLALCTIASLPGSIATFYVGLLAFSDLMAILVRTVIHFLNKEKLLNPTTAYWQVFPLLFDFMVSYSNWLLVLICVDRFITVRFPLQRRFYFTIRHARIAALGMAVLLFSCYFAAVRILGYMDKRMFTVRNLLYSVIPLFFIVIFIVLIAVQFRIIRKKRKFLQEGGGGVNAPNGTAPSNPKYKSKFSLYSSFHRPAESNTRSESIRSCPAALSNEISGSRGRPSKRSNVFEDIERLENNITIMMLVTAICFAILTIPNCVLLFTYPYALEYWNTPLARARWHVFSKTSQVLTFLNLSINFMLYFLSANKFRHQLCKLLRCGRVLDRDKGDNANQKSLLVHSSAETYL